MVKSCSWEATIELLVMMENNDSPADSGSKMTDDDRQYYWKAADFHAGKQPMTNI